MKIAFTCANMKKCIQTFASNICTIWYQEKLFHLVNKDRQRQFVTRKHNISVIYI